MSEDIATMLDAVLARKDCVDGELFPDPDGIDGREGIEDCFWSFPNMPTREGKDSSQWWVDIGDGHESAVGSAKRGEDIMIRSVLQESGNDGARVCCRVCHGEI